MHSAKPVRTVARFVEETYIYLCVFPQRVIYIFCDFARTIDVVQRKRRLSFVHCLAQWLHIRHAWLLVPKVILCSWVEAKMIAAFDRTYGVYIGSECSSMTDDRADVYTCAICARSAHSLVKKFVYMVVVAITIWLYGRKDVVRGAVVGGSEASGKRTGKWQNAHPHTYTASRVNVDYIEKLRSLLMTQTQFVVGALKGFRGARAKR